MSAVRTILPFGMLAAVGVLLAQPVWAASTERVSVSGSEAEAAGESNRAVMTPNGRFVAFRSLAGNLVPNDTNGFNDIFVRDLLVGTTELVSVSTGGVLGDSNADTGFSISPDGRFVAFTSYATNLVAGDTNNQLDVFIRDREAGTTERVNVATGGAEATAFSLGASVSASGRFVAFASNASNLVPGDANGAIDIFVRDRTMGTTELLSVDSNEIQSNGDSYQPVISNNGRLVFFMSQGSNLALPNDTNTLEDVFLRDRQTGTTEKVSVNALGAQANSFSSSPSINADGRFVAFYSAASNLVSGDNNGTSDVFVRDLQTDTTERVSLGIAGEAGQSSFNPSISSAGRFVTFVSNAGNLVVGDTNNLQDAFVRDRATGTTQRVSVSGAGGQSNDHAESPSISSDGRFVTFASRASNLIPDDTNGANDIFVRDRGRLSDSRNDLLADLGATGLWQRSPIGRWAKIDAGSPIAVAAGDLDQSFIEEAIASFPGRGILARYNNAGAWVRLHGWTADGVATGDLDGNGKDELIADFGANGLYTRYNNAGAWVKMHARSPTQVAVADLDGSGKDEVIADFPGLGLYARYNNAGAWVRLHTLSPVYVAIGDVDGDGKDDVIGDFGSGQGISVRSRNADPWRKIIATPSQGLAVGDLDADGRDDVIADFSNGLRVRYNSVNPWFTLDTRSPTNVISLDLDRNGMDDVVAGFTDAGISARLNGIAAWHILRPVLEQSFAAGSFN